MSIRGQNYQRIIDIDSETGTEAASLTSPSGISENILVLGIYGNYQIMSFLRVQLDLAYVDIYNYENVTGAAVSNFQSAVSLIFQL